MITCVNEQEFEGFLAQNPMALVDFWAEWCLPCRMMATVLEDLEAESPSLAIGKVDVDECPNLADRFGVDAIPHLVLFQNGEPREKMVGVHTLEDVKAALARLSKKE